MNKLTLILIVVLFGCTQNQPTREVLNCQREPIKDSGTLFVGGSRTKDQIDCRTVKIPLSPKAVPLSIDPKLIDKK